MPDTHTGAFLSVYFPSLKRDFPVNIPPDTPYIIGRSKNAHLRFDGPGYTYISNRHCYIYRHGDDFYLFDGSPDGRPSRNGTYVNYQPVSPQGHRLRSGDEIRIGDPRESIRIQFMLSGDAPRAAEKRADTFTLDRVQGSRPIRLGRSRRRADMVIDNPTVSGVHAEIRQEGGVTVIEDLDSSNGTFVNGVRIRKSRINPGDEIRLGNARLTFKESGVRHEVENGMRLDVVNLNKTYPRAPRPTLVGINFTIMPGEFVSIVGGSGAGKSTLMKVLNGSLLADSGTHVSLNGYDFYKYYDHYRTLVGYVPQYEILHKVLPVERALYYTAKLRLPEDTTNAEIQNLITHALKTVEMDDPSLRCRRIRDLSGGQQKRVSIAAELLADPKLFFLDEPTSGLDPGLERKMMVTLRRMAEEGRTIILITHATENISESNLVAFISYGRMVYFGPPSSAPDFFRVRSFTAIYPEIDNRDVYENWRSEYERSTHFRQFVIERQHTRPQLGAGTGGTSIPHPARTNPAYQFRLLSQRMLAVIRQDYVALAVLMVVMPLIGGIIVGISNKLVLVGDDMLLGNYKGWKDTESRLFIMTLATILLGIFGASNEFIKEREIFRRESMVNLKLMPYLTSKLVVLSGFALLQCALLLAVLSLGIQFPGNGIALPAMPEFFITLFLSTMASISLGLLISAAAPTPNVIAYLVMIVLFLQIVFSNAIFPLEGAAESLTYVMISRWSLEGLGTTNQLPVMSEQFAILGPGGEITPPALNYGSELGDLMLIWGVLIFFAFLYAVGSYYFLRRDIHQKA